jgi:hypothetical protein
VVLDEPKLHRRTLSPSPSLRKKGTTSHALLRSPLPPKIPLGEFAIPHHPRRARPRRERLPIAPGPPRRSSGRGIAAWCVTPPPLPAGAAVSRPHLDERPRLEDQIPFDSFNPSRRSSDGRSWFNEVSMDPWTGRHGPGLRTVDLFHRFFNRKIIH